MNQNLWYQIYEKSRTGRLVSLLTLYLSLCMTISFLLSYQLEILSCLSLGKMVGAVPARERTSSCEGIIAVFFLWITWMIKWEIQRSHIPWISNEEILTSGMAFVTARDSSKMDWISFAKSRVFWSESKWRLKWTALRTLSELL